MSKTKRLDAGLVYAISLFVAWIGSAHGQDAEFPVMPNIGVETHTIRSQDTLAPFAEPEAEPEKERPINCSYWPYRRCLGLRYNVPRKCCGRPMPPKCPCGTGLCPRHNRPNHPLQSTNPRGACYWVPRLGIGDGPYPEITR